MPTETSKKNLPDEDENIGIKSLGSLIIFICTGKIVEGIVPTFPEVYCSSLKDIVYAMLRSDWK